MAIDDWVRGKRLAGWQVGNIIISFYSDSAPDSNLVLTSAIMDRGSHVRTMNSHILCNHPRQETRHGVNYAKWTLRHENVCLDQKAKFPVVIRRHRYCVFCVSETVQGQSSSLRGNRRQQFHAMPIYLSTELRLLGGRLMATYPVIGLA